MDSHEDRSFSLKWRLIDSHLQRFTWTFVNRNHSARIARTHQQSFHRIFSLRASPGGEVLFPDAGFFSAVEEHVCFILFKRYFHPANKVALSQITNERAEINETSVESFKIYQSCSYLEVRSLTIMPNQGKESWLK